MSYLSIKGAGLIFGAFPLVLSSLAAPQFFSACLFLAMILLGINSAFSFLEAVITMLQDTRAFHTYSRRSIVTVTSVIGFLTSLCYCHDAGYNLMETIDYYINVVMLFVGICETLAACWAFRMEETIIVCGFLPTFLLFCSIFFSSLLAAVGGFIGGSITAGITLGCLSALGFFTASLYFLKTRGTMELGYKDKLYELLLGNVEYLRFRFNRGSHDDLMTAQTQKWYRVIPRSWSWNIKFGVPPILILLLFNILCAEVDNDDGGQHEEVQFGTFRGLATGYQAIGMFVASFGIVMVFLGLACPQLFEGLEYQSSDKEPEYMQEYHQLQRIKRAQYKDKSKMDPELISAVAA